MMSQSNHDDLSGWIFAGGIAMFLTVFVVWVGTETRKGWRRTVRGVFLALGIFAGIMMLLEHYLLILMRQN
jgi:hypothetical protein